MRRIGFAATGILAALVSAGAVYGFGYLTYLNGKIIHTNEDLPTEGVVSGKPINVLILGSDTREGVTDDICPECGTTEDVGGERADTILLMHVDPELNKVVLLHFPRDLRVDIPGQGLNKINTAFSGGPDLMLRTIGQYTGLPIHHYVQVSFAGFQKLVDAVGGVKMCVDQAMHDRYTFLNIPAAGCYHFDGLRSLQFVRSRHVEGDVIPDFNRIARQQQFIRALLGKILSPSSLWRLPSYGTEAIQNVTVDRGLNAVGIKDLVARLQGVGTPAVDFRVIPGYTQTIDGVSYVLPVQEQADELFLRLRNGAELGNLGRELPYTVLPANIAVRVMDGGGNVVAMERLLRQGGFDLRPARPAPEGFSTTQILYTRGYDPKAADVLGFLAPFIGEIPVVRTTKAKIGAIVIAVVVGPDFTGQTAV